VLAYLFYLTSTRIAFIGINIPAVNMIASVFGIFTITLCYKGTLLKRVLSVVSILAIMLFAEVVMSGIMGLSLDSVMVTMYGLTEFTVVSAGVLALVMSLAFRTCRNISKHTNALMFYLHDAVAGAYEDKLRTTEALTAQLQHIMEKEQIASRAKSVFLSAMSHEMRTPMSTIIGMIEIAKRAKTIEKKTKPCIILTLPQGNLWV